MNEKERLAAVKEMRTQQQLEILVEMKLLKKSSGNIAKVTGLPDTEVIEIRQLLNRAEYLKRIESLKLRGYRRLKREYNVQNFHLRQGW
jgi:hypothetical protein